MPSPPLWRALTPLWPVVHPLPVVAAGRVATVAGSVVVTVTRLQYEKLVRLRREYRLESFAVPKGR